jgi:hypothetical protein
MLILQSALCSCCNLRRLIENRQEYVDFVPVQRIDVDEIFRKSNTCPVFKKKFARMDIVVEAARKSKFSVDQAANYRQTGWIKYSIVPGKVLLKVNYSSFVDFYNDNEDISWFIEKISSFGWEIHPRDTINAYAMSYSGTFSTPPNV